MSLLEIAVRGFPCLVVGGVSLHLLAEDVRAGAGVTGERGRGGRCGGEGPRGRVIGDPAIGEVVRGAGGAGEE